MRSVDPLLSISSAFYFFCNDLDYFACLFKVCTSSSTFCSERPCIFILLVSLLFREGRGIRCKENSVCLLAFRGKLPYAYYSCTATATRAYLSRGMHVHYLTFLLPFLLAAVPGKTRHFRDISLPRWKEACSARPASSNSKAGNKLCIGIFRYSILQSASLGALRFTHLHFQQLKGPRVRSVTW